MSAKVTLTVIKGPLEGQQFSYEERTTCIVGRDEDCNLLIPTTKDRNTVSRHHCLFDINPPDVRIRDFGSLNGTWVNGQKIGQRPRDQEPDGGTWAKSLQYDLHDQDEIRLGNTTLRVCVHIPVYCMHCSSEIPVPESPASAAASMSNVCQACQEKLQAAKVPAKPAVKEAKSPRRVCARCGRDVEQEAGIRAGEYVCAKCRSDPFEIMRQMLKAASTGEKQLVAIEGYEILKELGQGGMAAVYLARHEKSAKEVALKILLPQVAASQRSVTRFLREIELMKLLRHPNIVRLHKTGCHNGVFFVILEYCDGGSVADLGKPLKVQQAVPIILQVLDGLRYAHQVEVKSLDAKSGKTVSGRGLVHRDVKPSNIFLCNSGRGVKAKLGDYGLAKAFDLAGLSGHTRAGSVGGTPYFMPRQQVLRFKYAQPEVDVWAAAASLYHMLTGFFPRDFPINEDPFLAVLQSAAVPIRKRGKDIPVPLARVIDAALIDDPEIKIKSAAELKQALEEAMP